MANKTDIFANSWNSNSDLVKRMKEDTNVLKTERIEEAFLAIDRKDFVRKDYQVEAYEDYAVPIGKGQTISQPTTVAYMLELLNPEPGDKVLDVGCGSGWTTALLAQIVGKGGQVIGVEIKKELAEFGQKNLERYNLPQAEIRNADIMKEVQKEAPFDKILVSAAAKSIPDILTQQLKKSGILVMPRGHDIVQLIKKSKTDFEETEHPGFRFVPLKT